MHFCMEWFQITAGYSYDCFLHTETAIPQAERDYFRSLREFLAYSELTIRIDKTIVHKFCS